MAIGNRHKKHRQTGERVIVNEEVIDIRHLRDEAKKAGTRFWVLVILISLMSSLVVPYLSMASVVASNSTVFDGDVIPGYSMGGIDIASYGVDLNSWAEPDNKIAASSSPAIVKSQYGYWTSDRAGNATKNLIASQKKDKDVENSDLNNFEIDNKAMMSNDEKARGWIGITRDDGEGTGLSGFSSNPSGTPVDGRNNYSEAVAPYRTLADYTFWDTQSIGGETPGITTTIYPDFVIVGWDAETKTARVLTNPDSVQNASTGDKSSSAASTGALQGTSAVPHYIPISTLFAAYGIDKEVMGDNGMITLDTLLDKISQDASEHDGKSPILNKIVENTAHDQKNDLLIGTEYQNLNGANRNTEKKTDAWNPYPYSMVFKMGLDEGTVVSSIYGNTEAYVYFSPMSVYNNYMALRAEYDTLINENATLVANEDPAAAFQLGYYLAGMSILEAYLNEALPQDMTRGYVGPVEGNPLASTNKALTNDKKLDTRSEAENTVSHLFKQSLSGVDQMSLAEEGGSDSAVGFKSVAYSQLMYDFADAAIVKFNQSGEKARLGATSAIMNTLSTYGYGTREQGVNVNGDRSAGQGPNRGMTRRSQMARITSFGPYANGAASLNASITEDKADPLFNPNVANNANTGMYIPVYYPIQGHVMPVDPEMAYRFQILSLIPYNTITYELGKHGFNNSVTLTYANDALNNLDNAKHYYNKSSALAKQLSDMDEANDSLGQYDKSRSIILNPQSSTSVMVGDMSTKEYSKNKDLTDRVDNALRAFAAGRLNSDNVHDLVDVVRAIPGVKYETFMRYYNPIKSSGGANDFFLTRISPAQTTYMPAMLTNGYESAGGITNNASIPATENASFDYFSIPSFAPCFAAHTSEDTYYNSLNYELRPFYTSSFLSGLSADTNVPALEQWEEIVDKEEEIDVETAMEHMKPKILTVYIMAKRLAYANAYSSLSVAANGKEGTVTLGSLYYASDKLKSILPNNKAITEALTPNNLSQYYDPEKDDGKNGVTENLVEGVLPSPESGGGDTDAASGGSMDENAKKIWQVFSQWGLTDEEVAGVLSNFQKECEIDPTGIEACYDDQYGMGGRKAAMAGNDNASKDAMSSWTQNEMRSAYAATGISLAWDFYGPGPDGRFYPGVGLCSWTGYSQVPQLMDKAQEMGKKWWDMDFQTAYLLVDPNNSPPGEALWQKMKSECAGRGAYDCAYWFYTTVEMPGNCGPAGWDHEHSQYAEEWLAKIKGWSKDEAYAKKIIDMAHRIAGGGSARSASAAGDDGTQVVTGSATTAQAPSDATDESASASNDGPYADNGGNADRVYASDGLESRNYNKATEAQWKALVDKSGKSTHVIGDQVTFYMPKGLSLGDLQDGDSLEYAMQQFGPQHMISDSVLGSKTVWCKDSNGYAFVTDVKTIFAALYKDCYNRYLSSKNGMYYWDSPKNLAQYDASAEVETKDGEKENYNTVASTKSKVKDGGVAAKKDLDLFCQEAFKEASISLARLSALNDLMPTQMQNVLAWADNQTPSESEQNYFTDPGNENTTLIAIGGEKEEGKVLSGANVKSFASLQEAGYQVITNNGDWAGVLTPAAARGDLLQSRMIRGVAGTTYTATVWPAAYTISATVGRIDRLASAQSSTSTIPYAGIYSGNLNSGAERCALGQSHSIDRQGISSRLAGDLRRRSTSGNMVSLSNSSSTPETQEYVKQNSNLTAEFMASTIPSSVDMLVDTIGSTTSDSSGKSLASTSGKTAELNLSGIVGGDADAMSLAGASTFNNTTMNRQSAAAQRFNTSSKKMMNSGASATASASNITANRDWASSLVSGSFSGAYAVIQSIALMMVLAFLMIIAFQNFVGYTSGNEADYISAQTKLKTVLPRTLIAMVMIGLPPMGGQPGFPGGCYLLLQIVNALMDSVLSVFTQGQTIADVLTKIGADFVWDFKIWDMAAALVNLVASLIFLACSAIIMLLVFLTDIVLFFFWVVGPIIWAFYVWPYSADEARQAHGLKGILSGFTGKMGSKMFTNGNVGHDAPAGWLMGYIMTLSTTVKWVLLYWGVGIAFNVLRGDESDGFLETVNKAFADETYPIHDVDAGAFLVEGTSTVFNGLFGNLLLALLFALVTYMTFRTFKNSMGGAIGAMYGMVGGAVSAIAKTAGNGALLGLGGADGKIAGVAEKLKESNNPWKKLGGEILDSKPVQLGAGAISRTAETAQNIANSTGGSDMKRRIDAMTDNLAKDVDQRADSSGAFDDLISLGTVEEEYTDENGNVKTRKRQVMQAAPALQMTGQLTGSLLSAQYQRNRHIATAANMGMQIARLGADSGYSQMRRDMEGRNDLKNMLGAMSPLATDDATAQSIDHVRHFMQEGSTRMSDVPTKKDIACVGNMLRQSMDGSDGYVSHIGRYSLEKQELAALQDKTKTPALTAEEATKAQALQQSISKTEQFAGALGSDAATLAKEFKAIESSKIDVAQVRQQQRDLISESIDSLEKDLGLAAEKQTHYLDKVETLSAIGEQLKPVVTAEVAEQLDAIVEKARSGSASQDEMMRMAAATMASATVSGASASDMFAEQIGQAGTKVVKGKKGKTRVEYTLGTSDYASAAKGIRNDQTRGTRTLSSANRSMRDGRAIADDAYENNGLRAAENRGTLAGQMRQQSATRRANTGSARELDSNLRQANPLYERASLKQPQLRDFAEKEKAHANEMTRPGGGLDARRRQSIDEAQDRYNALLEEASRDFDKEYDRLERRRDVLRKSLVQPGGSPQSFQKTTTELQKVSDDMDRLIASAPKALRSIEQSRANQEREADERRAKDEATIRGSVQYTDDLLGMTEEERHREAIRQRDAAMHNVTLVNDSHDETGNRGK